MNLLFSLSFLYCHCYAVPVAQLQLDMVSLQAGNFCNETPKSYNLDQVV